MEYEHHALPNDTDGTSCQNNSRVRNKKKKPAPSPPTSSQKNDKVNNRKECVVRPPLDASTHHQTQDGCIKAPEKVAERTEVLRDAKPSLDDFILLVPHRQCYSSSAGEKIPSQYNNNQEFQEETSQSELHPFSEENKRFGKVQETAIKTTEKVTVTSGSYSKNGPSPDPSPIRRFASSPSKVSNIALRQHFFRTCEINDGKTAVTPKCANGQRNEKLSSPEPGNSTLPGASRRENSTRAPQDYPIAKPRLKKKFDELEFSSVQIICTGTPIMPEAKNSMVTLSSGVVTEPVCQINEQTDNIDEISTPAVGHKEEHKNAYQQPESSEEHHDVVYDGECCDDVETIRL